MIFPVFHSRKYATNDVFRLCLWQHNILIWRFTLFKFALLFATRSISAPVHMNFIVFGQTKKNEILPVATRGRAPPPPPHRPNNRCCHYQCRLLLLCPLILRLYQEQTHVALFVWYWLKNYIPWHIVCFKPNVDHLSIEIKLCCGCNLNFANCSLHSKSIKTWPNSFQIYLN